MKTSKGLAIGLTMLAAAAAPVFASGAALAGDDAAASQTPNPLQIARGAKAWANNCGRCHNIRDPKEFSDKDWDVIVAQMRVRAMLPGEVARDILVFLKSSN